MILDFALFWQGWPKKTDKAEAEKLWEKLDDSTRQIIITDVLRRVTSHSQWRDKEWIPSPARYLRRQLWNDEIIEAKTPEQKQAEAEDGTVHSRFQPGLHTPP